MSVTLKLALGEMSTRRSLLLQSLVERAGGRLSPRWEMVMASDEADVLLFDPAVGQPETTARALPVVERADYAAGDGLGLCFPATTAEFCAFLEDAARTLRVTTSSLPTDLQSLADATQALIAGGREGLTLEAGDGLRFGLSAVYGAPRVHVGSDERVAERMREPGFLRTARLLQEKPVTGSGSLQQGQFFVWALARELAQHGYPLVAVDARLKLRRWPLPPEPFIGRRDAMRICTRLAPGNVDLRTLERSEQHATADAIALINAGVLLGFVAAEAAPAPVPAAEPEAVAPPGSRYGGLMQALRSAFGLTARAH